jgi:hypothetical protein
LGKRPLIAIHGEYGIGKSSLLYRTQRFIGSDWNVFVGNLGWMRTDDERHFTEEFFEMVSKNFGHVDRWPELATFLRRQRSVFLLDEFGQLTSAVAATFIHRICLLADEVTRQVQVIVALPVSIDKFLLGRGIANPKYIRPWSSIHISALNEHGVEKLLRLLPEPAYRIAERYRSIVMALSEGRPRKVQCLCYNLFEQIQAGQSEAEFTETIHDQESYERAL